MASEEQIFREIGVPLEAFDRTGTADPAEEVLRGIGVPTQMIEQAGSRREEYLKRTKRPVGIDPVETITGERRKTPETEKAKRFSQMTLGEMKEEFGTDTLGAMGKNLQLAYMMFTTPSDEERVQILKEIAPGTTDRTDEFGNVFVKYPNAEKERIVNKPGATFGDALMLTQEAAKGATVARAGGLVSSPIGKMAAVGAAEAGMGYAQEAAQVLQGGTFDPLDPLFAAAAGSLFEGGPVIKSIYRRMTPSGRKLLQQEGMLNSAVMEGIGREDLEAIQKVMAENNARFSEEGLRQLPAVVQMAGKTAEEAGFAQPLAQMGAAAGTKEGFGRAVRKEYGALSQSAKDSVQRSIENLSPLGAGQIESLEAASRTMEKFLREGRMERSSIAKQKYEAAFEGIEEVNVRPAMDQIGAFLKNDAPSGSPLEKKLVNINQQLSDNFVTDTIPPKKVQNIILELRDIQKIQNDKSVTSAVKEKARLLNQNLTKILNKATKDKYGQADKAYAEMSEVLSRIQKSSIGKAADLEGEDLAGLVGMLFNPGKEAREYSKRFFKVLRNEDPQTAKDLISVHLTNALEDAGDSPTATKLLDSLFGTKEGTANMVLQIADEAAPRSGLVNRLMAVRDYLQFAQKMEFVDPDTIAKRLASESLPNGALMYRIGELGTIPTTLKQEGKQRQVKRNARLWMEMAMDDTWGRELAEILKLPKTSKERLSKASSLFGRFAENIAEQESADVFAKTAGSALLESTQELPRTPNETDSE